MHGAASVGTGGGELGHADARTTRRYDHGGARLDRSPSYRLTEYLVM